VDREDRLRKVVQALNALHNEYGYPVLCSLHPRTRSRAEEFGVDLTRTGIRFVPPLGFFDFVQLERNAACILSDSGTVQEEACLFGVPNVTLRDVTERPETVECGANFLAGVEPESVVRAVRFVIGRTGAWKAPAEYLETHVAETVCRVLLGFRLPDLAETEWSRKPVQPPTLISA
jgi:UDP-N-acetylglucosamine 2-epimerase (non-hydrolysing)